jgi:pimeloyl-ACP methyl ester carboxylesterase
VWDAVVGRLRRDDVTRLDLPGFGCALPAGFDPVKESYLEWLVGELDEMSRPIDLVAHDWGAILALRAVSVRPDLVRTWAAGGGPIDERYVWHEWARIWQTPGAGEEAMTLLTPEALAAGLTDAGLSARDAERAAACVDETMKSSILSLYRSAVRVGEEWAPALVHVTAPGLVLWGENDPYAGVDVAARMAERVGAELLAFRGCGHWWQLERADEVAAALERHWAASS